MKTAESWLTHVVDSLSTAATVGDCRHVVIECAVKRMRISEVKRWSVVMLVDEYEVALDALSRPAFYQFLVESLWLGF